MMGTKQILLTVLFGIHRIAFVVLLVRRRRLSMLLPIAVFTLLILTQLLWASDAVVTLRPFAPSPLPKMLRQAAILLAIPSIGLMGEQDASLASSMSRSITVADLQLGAWQDESETRFGQQCAPCHGAKGKGNGVAAIALNPKPRDFTSAKFITEFTPEKVIASITTGKGSMPSFGPLLTEDQITRMANYVLNLSNRGTSSTVFHTR